MPVPAFRRCDSNARAALAIFHVGLPLVTSASGCVFFNALTIVDLSISKLSARAFRLYVCISVTPLYLKHLLDHHKNIVPSDPPGSSDQRLTAAVGEGP